MRAGHDISCEGEQWLLYIGGGSNSTDDNDRKLPKEGVGIGIGDIELIGTGYCLFVRGDSLEPNISEDGLTAIEQQIKAGAAVGHVGETIAAGVVRQVVAAGIDDPYQFQTAGGSIGQYHCDFLSGHKWEILLQQDRAHAGSAAYSHSMETVRNPVIIGDGAKAGVDCIGIAVNRDIDREVIG